MTAEEKDRLYTIIAKLMMGKPISVDDERFYLIYGLNHTPEEAAAIIAISEETKPGVLVD